MIFALTAMMALGCSTGVCNSSMIAAGSNTHFDTKISRVDLQQPLNPKRSGTEHWDLWLNGTFSTATAQNKRDFGLTTSIGLGLSADDNQRARFGFHFTSLIESTLFAWNTLYPGTLIVNLGWELYVGNQYWWASNTKNSVLLGARLVFGAGHPIKSELHYHFVPANLSADPAALDVRRLEHRVKLFVAYQHYAIGLHANLATLNVLQIQPRSSKKPAQWQNLFERDLGLSFQYRF